MISGSIYPCLRFRGFYLWPMMSNWELVLTKFCKQMTSVRWAFVTGVCVFHLSVRFDKEHYESVVH